MSELRRGRTADEGGFTLIEIVIAISLLVVMMVPFADAYMTSFTATTDAHTREVAAMVADGALDQARALDATDQQNGCLLLAGRSATAVQTEWNNPAPGMTQILNDTAQASDTSADCASSSTTPLPTTPQKQTVGDQTFEIYYYVGNCWETENTSSSSTNTCTDPASPPSTDYEMYRVVADVTWSAPQGGCGTSGCDYVTSTLISATSNPSFDVNPILPYINNTSDTTTFTIDSPGAFQFTSTGFPPPTFTDAAYGNGACTPTTLPTGITLSSSGLLSGTPQPGSAGSDYVVCVNATNTSGTGTETFILVVDLIPTSLTLTVGNNGSVTYGNAATLTAVVTPSTATGTVTFTSGSTTLCTANISSGTASCSTSTSLAAGTYTITASYPAGNTYSAATSNTATLTVNPVQTSNSIKVNSSISPQTITYGSTATLTATLSPTASPGSVNFTSGATTLCSATVSSGTASCPTSSTLAAGAYTVGATYTPSNGNYTSSTSSNTVSLTVDQVPSITSSNDTSFTIGSAGSFQVIASGYPSPTFTNSSWTGTSSCTASTLPSGITLSSTGLLSGTPPAGSAGTYTVCLQASNSVGTGKQAFTLTVGLVPTSLTLTLGKASITYGNADTLSASMSPSAATGTVTFSSGSTTLCTASLLSGTASCPTSTSLAPGTYSVTANYPAGGTYAAATSSSATLTVNPIQTSNSITVNGSTSAQTITYGSTATLSATVSPSAAPGSVTFSSGSTTLCTATVASGTASCPTSSTLAGGAYTVSATFTPSNSDYGSSTSSNTISLTVNPVQTSNSITVNGSTSAQTITYGSTATLAATVSPSAAPGTVTFSSGSTTLCTATVSSGTASCSTSSTLAGGAYTVSATYNPTSGNSNYSSSASSNTVSLTVDEVPSVTSAASTTFTVGSAGTFDAAATGYPSSPITFQDKTSGSCTASTLPSGVTFSSAGVLSGTPASGTVGSYTLCIIGTNSVGSGSAETFTLTISKATPTVSVSGVLNKGNPASITFTATVAGSSITPTGSVTWTGVTCSSTTSLSGSSGTSTATCTVDNVSGTQSYTATAAYGGDSNYNTASGTSSAVKG